MDHVVEGYRLSSQQRRVWSLGADRQLYRVQYVVRLAGPLTIDTLYAAACAVTARHDILRTTFYRQPGRTFPIQVIHDTATPGWRVVDLSAQSPDQQEQAIAALLYSDGAAPLSDGSSQLRLTLLALATNKHDLLITLPALCADAPSLETLVAELSAEYTRLSENPATRAVDDADEVVQYVQFSEWQNEQIESEDDAEGQAFWYNQQVTGWSKLHLPFESHLSSSEAERASHTSTIAKPLTAAIESFAQKQDVSQALVLLACWEALLYRLTGQHDVGIAYVRGQRIYEDLEQTLGLFTTWLPLRGQFSPNSQFQEIVQQALVSVQRAETWQESWMRDGQLSGGDHAFQHLVGFEFAAWPAVQTAGDLSFTVVQQHIALDRFKLKLSCWQRDDTLQLSFEYDPALFSTEAISALDNQLQTLLEAALARPQTLVDELPLLSQVQRQQLLVDFNATQSLWTEQCIHALFQSQAIVHPERVAVVFEDQRLTYAELNARANQLAHYLQSLGVKPDMPVALAIERSAEMMIGLLAILKAGGAYVPLDPTLPPERLHFMLKVTQASILLTRQHGLEQLPTDQVQVVCLDRDWDTLAEQPISNPVSNVTPQNLAYVLFTSGSTGKPKGVTIAHAQLHNYVRAITKRLALPDDASYALVSTFAADLGNTAIFPALCSGGTLHVISQERVFDPDALADYFRAQPVDCLKIVPSHLNVLLQAAQPQHILPRKQLVLGGEASDWSLVTRVREYAPDCTVLNHYGPTETTVGVLTYQVTPSERGSTTASLPLGQPLANTAVYLLDRQQQPVPIGLPGEIYIGGTQVARGYLHQSALTAERFVPDPFAGTPGVRLYRTGDRARYRADGTIEFLGRVDHQVKIHGFRIELGEIEAVLADHPAIREAVVMRRENSQGEPSLVAYITPRQSAPQLPSHLRRTTLPNQLTIAHLNQDETRHLYQQIFVDQIYTRHGMRLNETDTIFDVGANIGMFSLFVKQLALGARIYAFEPAPPTAEVFLANAALHAPDTTFFNCGLSDRSGEATYTFYPHASVMSGLYPNPTEESELLRQFVDNRQHSDQPHQALLTHIDDLAEARFQAQTFRCPLRTISDVIAEHQIERIDLLKVDVEKSELDVLRGIQPQDWPKIQQLVVEVHAFEDRPTLIARMLEDQGFTVVVDQDQPLAKTPIFQVYARREALGTRGAAAPHQATRVGAESAQLQLAPTELRNYLKRWLPEHMIPAHFVQLDSLPLTANGKLDRQALPELEHKRPASDQPFVAPRAPAEIILAQIWSDILGVDQIGIHDNFFQLGGDSILTIQVVARAHQAGLQFSPRHLFAHQTIAELSEVVETLQPAQIDQQPASGPLPLLPIQQWFFAQEMPDPSRSTIAVLLEARQPLDPALVAQAITGLVDHHDALRTSFSSSEHDWHATIHDQTTESLLTTLDLSDVPEAHQAAALEAEIAQLQARIELAQPPLLRGVMINRNHDLPAQLLIAIHRLVVDNGSWRILLEHFQAAYTQLSAGQALQLPPKTSSIQEWANRLSEYARSPELERELDFWLAQGQAPSGALPIDVAELPARITLDQELSLSLNVEETRALLHEVPKAYHTQINDVLLTALAQTLAQITGTRRSLIDLEGHGRDALFNDIDVSQTVGWFTTLFPLRLDVDTRMETSAALKAVKEQLRQIPQHGIGYGLLRYLNRRPEIQAHVSSLPQPQILFRYVSQFRDLPQPFVAVRDQYDASGTTRQHLLAIMAGVTGEQFVISWAYSTAVHERATIEDLAQRFMHSLRHLITHCCTVTGYDFTPSDFPLAGLDQQQLDQLLNKFKK